MPKRIKWRKEIRVYPGYDKRDPDPHKNYGVHGCEVRFILHGPKGAITFLLFTDWLPNHVQESRMGRNTSSSVAQEVIGVQPMGADISYHSTVPITDSDKDPDWSSRRDKCPFLNGRPCYSDGSGLHAERIRDKMLTGGDTIVWQEMRKYYRQTFDPDRKATIDNANFGELTNAVTKALKGDNDGEAD